MARWIRLRRWPTALPRTSPSAGRPRRSRILAPLESRLAELGITPGPQARQAAATLTGAPARSHWSSCGSQYREPTHSDGEAERIEWAPLAEVRLGTAKGEIVSGPTLITLLLADETDADRAG